MADSSTLYSHIIQFIKKKIFDGEYQPGMKLPSELELAEMFNVSRITSKRALDELEGQQLIFRKRGSGSFVNFRTEGSVSAVGIPRENDLIVMIMPFDVLGGRFIEITQSATNILNHHGYHLLLYSTHKDLNKERELLLQAQEKGARGVILYPYKNNKNYETLYKLWLEKFPIITIDKRIYDIPISSIISDSFKGTFDLTKCLLEKGHRRVAFVSECGMDDMSSVKSRYFGYCSALSESGIAIDEKLVVNGYLDGDLQEVSSEEKKESTTELVKKLISSGVTAVVAVNDYIAFNIINACNFLGLSVPKDLSVVGFDNLELSEFFNPALTTAEQDFNRIGTLAAQLILEKIAGNSSGETHHTIPVNVILRDSVCEPGKESPKSFGSGIA